jgi:hypothetical protein
MRILRFELNFLTFKCDLEHGPRNEVKNGRVRLFFAARKILVFPYPVLFPLLILPESHVVGDGCDSDPVGRLPVDGVELEPRVTLLLRRSGWTGV